MATPPVFTAGAVLTAAQMNGIGLWLVKTQTIGSAVSSVTVTDAFSADYDNYLITVTGGVGSTAGDLSMQLGATTTGYSGFATYGVYSTNTVLGVGNSNTASWFVGSVRTTKIDAVITVCSPFLTDETTYHSQWAAAEASAASGVANGALVNSTSYTAFTLATSSGTMTGGEIKVYGYRN